MPSLPTSDTFPIVLRHMDAVGIKEGREQAASVIPNLAVLLVARGANRVIIPVPDALELERVESGVSGLPAERRNLIQLTDKSGDLLHRVREFLDPLRTQSTRWPEDAFVGFAATFLYEVVLGLKHRAGVLSDAASVVRDFVPIIDPSQFRGEARFRLAELCRLICSYEPGVVEHGLYATETAGGTTGNALDIMDTAEFHKIVSESGRIGYVKHPLPALRRLRKWFLALMKNPVASGTLKLASTAADAAGGAGLATASAEVLGIGMNRDGSFNPPFISLGPAQVSLYRAVLRETLPGAAPPEGAFMVFKSASGISWLNVGDESKLQEEALGGITPRIKKHREAVAALDELVG